MTDIGRSFDWEVLIFPTLYRHSYLKSVDFSRFQVVLKKDTSEVLSVSVPTCDLPFRPINRMKQLIGHRRSSVSPC